MRAVRVALAVLVVLALAAPAAGAVGAPRAAADVSTLLPWPFDPDPEPEPGAPPTTDPPPSSQPATAAQVRESLRVALQAADRGRRVPRRTGPPLETLVDDRGTLEDRCIAGLDIDDTQHDICPLGDTSGRRTVAIIGSSHASMWVNGLEGPAADRGVRLVPFVKFGCSPLVMRTRVYGKAWPACAEYRKWALARIAELSPDLVVVSTHSYTNIDNGRGGQLREGSKRYERTYARGMRRLVSRLGAVSDDVVVLGSVARRGPAVRPLRCLEREDDRLAPCENRLDRRDNAIRDRDRTAARAAGGRYVDANRLTCERRRCPVAAADTYVYRDFSHVSRTWSLYVGGVLAQRLGM
ncbi:hypothetical protein KLP28_16255 [Nocardioidaceae bacterium]|nr:hypothetical protein KLP28_16255 [Nocardioidaceae bacterium]